MITSPVFSPFCLLDWFKISWALARPESSKCDPTIFRGNGQDDEIENWLIYLRVESILTLLFSENIFEKNRRTLNFWFIENYRLIAAIFFYCVFVVRFDDNLAQVVFKFCNRFNFIWQYCILFFMSLQQWMENFGLWSLDICD